MSFNQSDTTGQDSRRKSTFMSQSLPRAPLDESQFNSGDSEQFTFDLDAHKPTTRLSSTSPQMASKPRRKPPPMDPDLLYNKPDTIPTSQRQNNISDLLKGLDSQIHSFSLKDGSGWSDEEEEEVDGLPQANDDDIPRRHVHSEPYDEMFSDGNVTYELSSPIEPLNPDTYQQVSPNPSPPLPQSQSDYDTDYSNSSPSISRFSDNQNIPYPLDSPIAPSSSSLSYSGPLSATDSPNLNAAYPSFGDDSRFGDDTPSPSQQAFPLSPSKSGSQSSFSTGKTVPLRPTISTPITNMQQFNTPNESLRNPTIMNSNSTTSSAFGGFPFNNNISGAPHNSYGSSSASARGHRKSNSFSSIWSSSSSKNINLATLKKTMNTRPGEGERSHYVTTLRKNAGTAYNESAPGKWKLPTGILPIDKKATYTSSNTKYIRLSGGVTSTKAKKGTGVGLKHGHLAPRLLATEVDDTDDISMKFKQQNDIKVIDEESPATSAATSTTALATDGSGTPKNLSSGSSLAVGGGAGSIDSKNALSRTITENSAISAVTSSQSKSTTDSKRLSVSSGSSGSISDVGNGFYQHPSYKYDRFDDQDDADSVEQDTVDIDEYKEAPKLFLANPDASDSD